MRCSWLCSLVLALVALLACSQAVATDRQIVDGDLSWAPYIIFDNEADRFRLFYHQRTAGHFYMVHRWSRDGRSWSGPQIVRDQIQSDGASWGASVIDTGHPGRTRFRNIHYWIGPGANGAYIANSADGITWDAPESRSTPFVNSDDQLNPFLLPGGGVGLFTKPRNTPLRETWISFGDADFERWTEPVPAFQRDENDSPTLEFYGAACCLYRDGRMIAFLRVLRDDLGSGAGYTVMAWSGDDGRTWERSREPFLRNCIGELDQAHAWIYGVAEHNGEILFSYSAYPEGHKVGARYIGIAHMQSSNLRLGNNVGPECSYN